MQTQLQKVKDLLESAVIIDETAKGEKKQKDKDAIPALTQGEHKEAENITPPEPTPETQRELTDKESTLPVSKPKVNKESPMVIYDYEKKDLGTLSQEKFMAQLKEIKRLAELKEQEKKSEKELKKLLNPATIKAQAQNLMEKFQWVINQAKRLGLPPPPELATFRLTAEEKKRKGTEFLKEDFVIEDVRVDGMNRNLTPHPGVVPMEGLVIKEPESGILFMNRNMEVMKGLSECKALESNVIRIQVKNTVKEVEDHLKTYSSAEMDISWYLEVIR
ncbi:hypothetical protein Tco_1146727 [Tanacetum coccineum]